MSWLSDFILKWYGSGTSEDQRNFGWRLSEYLRVQVLWAWTVVDLRMGTVRKRKFLGLGYFWPIYGRLPYKTEENCWNGFMTLQVYLTRYVFHTIWALVLCINALLEVGLRLLLWWVWSYELSFFIWGFEVAVLLWLPLLSLVSCFVWPKVHFLFRPVRSRMLLVYWVGLLFDRGEYSWKVAIMEPAQSEPQGWEEGSV